MLAKNGAGPATAETANEARKVVDTGKDDGRPSKPSNNRPQIIRAQLIGPCAVAPTLPELAQRIRAEHAAVVRAAADVLAHVLDAGRALIAAQNLVPTGQWGHWLRRNCDVSERHARRYIALTQAYEASGHSVSADLVGMSLRGLMRQLTPPKPRQVARPPARKSKPAATSIGLNCRLWSDASQRERQGFVDAVGWKSLAEAIPPNWYPTIDEWLQARFRPEQLAPPPDLSGDRAIPADLSIPVFLQRTKVTA